MEIKRDIGRQTQGRVRLNQTDKLTDSGKDGVGASDHAG